LDPAVLDRIESRWTSSDAGLAKWDDLFHGDLAIRAVRNRRERFQSWLAVREERAGGRPVRVLDLGCGPGWPIAAHLAEHPSSGARFVAVDSNPEVLTRAAQVCRGGAGRVDFVCADPARYVPVGRGVDLVWSGGMLERLSDRLAVVVVGRIWEMLPVGGEFVLGNLAAGNPSRAYLEVMLGWSAYHRSAEDLEELARHAGIPAGAAEVGAEPLGVGLFLRARKGG
jgi:extracellular factor (EF) 3-hydroxypalmitic acid methyl ester biosynthesis protein